MITFVPKHWNVEADPQSPPHARGIPSVVNYDVVSKELPSCIPAQSVDVALFKTVGSVFVQSEEILMGFWDKMIRTMKPGGLLVTTDSIPQSVKHNFVPYQPMISAIGTHKLTLNASHAYDSLMGGYTASEFICYSFVGEQK